MRMHNSLPLNNLNTFAAAGKYLSFQKAAESLFVTPSAVSHQVRNLESILGYKLFKRLDKKVKFTPQGERLFNDIQAPISQLHEASRKAIRGLGGNTLTLSVAPVFATGWLMPRLKDFYNRYPEINLSVIASTDLVDLISGPFDASIRLGTGNWQGLVTHHLYNSEMIAVCSPQMLESNEALFTPEELYKFPLVHNLPVPKLWNQWFQSAGIEIPIESNSMLQVQSSSQVIEALQSGDSVGLIDRNFIENDIRIGRLAIACEHVFEDVNSYFLTYPQSVQGLPSLEAFKKWLGTQLNEDSNGF